MVLDVVVAFGKVLRKLRKKAGLSQEELGFAAGLQRNFISLLELGSKQPTLSTMLKVSKALGMRLSEFSRLIEECMDAEE